MADPSLPGGGGDWKAVLALADLVEDSKAGSTAQELASEDRA